MKNLVRRGIKVHSPYRFILQTQEASLFKRQFCLYLCNPHLIHCRNSAPPLYILYTGPHSRYQFWVNDQALYLSVPAASRLSSVIDTTIVITYLSTA
jgi:uncharacterized protein YbcV (DUF1398 family)